jgi:hypothetical protein
MAYAPYTNDRRTEDQGRVLGCFTECDHGHRFEYAERTDALFPADFHPDMPHVVFVGERDVRLASIKRGVLTLINGDEKVEKWMIKQHRVYEQ